jgi:hypothetical protein
MPPQDKREDEVSLHADRPQEKFQHISIIIEMCAKKLAIPSLCLGTPYPSVISSTWIYVFHSTYYSHTMLVLPH